MTRQEAVKWLSNLKMDIGKTQHQELWHYEQALDEIIQTLEQEPIRCKDCKHFNDGDCEELPKIVSETDFCSFAEREEA